MNKRTAREIAESGITWDEIRALLKRAYEAGACNTSRSKGNPVITKAFAFNIFVDGTPTSGPIFRSAHITMATNVLYEFGDYWQGWEPEKPTERIEECEPEHQEPRPPNWDSDIP